MKENFKTWMLLVLLSAALVFIGGAIGGRTGLILAVLLALVMNGVAYWFSDKIALKMSRAQPLDRDQAPELYLMLENLSHKAGIPTPKLYLIASPIPNAFATGRNPQNGVVAVTSGLLEKLGQRELAGVIAHELAHIKNHDILTSSVVATLAGAISGIADWVFWSSLFNNDEDNNPIASFVFMLVAPIAAMLVQLAVSRSREFVADETAAHITGDPEGLARALERLHEPLPAYAQNYAPKPAHASMYIANQFSMQGAAKLFSTHPPYQERTARLRAMLRF